MLNDDDQDHGHDDDDNDVWTPGGQKGMMVDDLGLDGDAAESVKKPATPGFFRRLMFGGWTTPEKGNRGGKNT